MTIFRRPYAVIAAVLTVAVSAGAYAQSKSVRIGTSSTGSVFYTLAVGLTRMLDKHAKISATAEPVGGSSANIFAIAADKVEVAVTNSGAAWDGYHGNKPFKKPVALGLIAQGQPSYRQFVVRVGSGITRPEDLAGKTIIGRRPALPEVGLITNALLKVYNINPKQVKIVSTTNTGEALKAIKAGTVDAALLPGSRGAGYLRRLAHDKQITFLQIPKAKIDAMLGLLPRSLSAAVLPAKVYENQNQPANVFALSTYLIADQRTSPDLVYAVTKTLFENLKEFHALHRAARQWTLKRTLRDPKVPFHRGAIRYFKEKGVWTAAHDKLQAELAKR